MIAYIYTYTPFNLFSICVNLVAVTTSMPTEISFERPPSILVPLKVHTPPKGYQLYMTCAIRGCPTPSVTWYLNDICINHDNNYYITNSYGVCSMSILRVRTKDSGEYRVVAVNSFGRAECSSKLLVKGEALQIQHNALDRCRLLFFTLLAVTLKYSLFFLTD